MNTLLWAGFSDKHCKGHRKYNNKSALAPVTENTDEIVLLVDETHRGRAIFARVNVSLSKVWVFQLLI